VIQALDASLVYRDQDRDVYACRDVEMTVGENEFIGILGPSGSGKSSLLYLLSGLKIPTAGSVRYRDRDLAVMGDAERSRLRLEDFGFVFQHPYLLGYLSALENVTIGGCNGAGLDEAAESLDRLGLGNKLHRRPHELSMGERQRVCVARAVLGQPKVVFADEPTAALDHANGLHVVELLNEHRGNGSLVMVTHDPSMLEGADRVLRLADGRLEE
jgi:putative ABC transport system ATP-binding protein